MTLQLSIPAELSERLAKAATQNDVTVEALAVQLLDQHLPAGNPARAISLLQSWIDSEKDTEQTETGEYLIKALDEDRLSHRKLFPPELEGVTW
jgi:hypothetical protein